MSVLVDLLVMSLATWRISSLLAEEDGPGEVFERLRQFAGVRYDEEGYAYGLNWLADIWHCMWCISGPVAAAWTVLYLLAPIVAFYTALPFALWATAIIINARGIRARKRT